MQNHPKKITLLLFLTMLISLSAQADIFGLEKPTPITPESMEPTIFDDFPKAQDDGSNQQAPSSADFHTSEAQKNTPPADIELIPVDKVLENVASSNGIVVLHISSEDTACRYCIDSNENFKQMIQRHPNTHNARFWMTGTNPYQDILKTAIAREYNIKNLPTTIVFNNGKVNKIWLAGTTKNDIHDWIFHNLNKTNNTKQVTFNREPHYPIPPEGSAPIGIKTIEANLIGRHIQKIINNSAPQPHELKNLNPTQQKQLIKERRPLILVSISSYDAGCPPCTSINQEIEALAKRYAGRIHFLRVMPTNWEEPFAFKQNYLIQQMPATLLFAGESLLYNAEGSYSVDILDQYLLHKNPEQDASKYQVSNELFELPSAPPQRKGARITQVPESEDSNLLLGHIQHSKGLLLVNISDQFRKSHAPSYLKILLGKYAGHIKFIHTNRPKNQRYAKKLADLFDLKGMPHVLLFKDGQLIRKHSLNLSSNEYDVLGDQSKHQTYAEEIERAFFSPIANTEMQ